MALLGQAAMVLSFNIIEASRIEHDRWHSQEHLQERLSIPGFMRGTRWQVDINEACTPYPYLVIYEVENLSILDSGAYLHRLNHPSPWTQKMMKSYQNMSRGLCSITASFGHGLGAFAYVIRFRCESQMLQNTLPKLSDDVLKTLPNEEGITSVHWLSNSMQASLTTEQTIRGKDAAPDQIVILTGYDQAATQHIGDTKLRHALTSHLEASQLSNDIYSLRHTLLGQEATNP